MRDDRENKTPQILKREKRQSDEKSTYRFYLIATYHLFKRKRGNVKVKKVIQDLTTRSKKKKRENYEIRKQVEHTRQSQQTKGIKHKKGNTIDTSHGKHKEKGRRKIGHGRTHT